MEKIKLSELLLACQDFKSNPTDANFAPISKICGQLQVREFLPLMDKQLAMVNVLYRVLEQDKDAVAIQCNLEVAKIVCGLLKYVINLENDLGEEPLLNAAVYDILYECGVVAAILDFCEEDYLNFCKMIDGAINFSNIFRMEKVAALMTPENLQEFINATKDLELAISSDKIKELAKIYESADDSRALFADIVKQAALNKALAPKAEIQPVSPDKKDDTDSGAGGGDKQEA